MILLFLGAVSALSLMMENQHQFVRWYTEIGVWEEQISTVGIHNLCCVAPGASRVTTSGSLEMLSRSHLRNTAPWKGPACDNSSHQSYREVSAMSSCAADTNNRNKALDTGGNPAAKQKHLTDMLPSADHAAYSVDFFPKSIRKVRKSGKNCLRPPRIEAIQPLWKEFPCQASAVMGIFMSPFSFRAWKLFGDYTDISQQQQQSHRQERPWASAGCDWGCGKAESTPRSL